MGMQLEKEARISIKRKNGGPMIYYRTLLSLPQQTHRRKGAARPLFHGRGGSQAGTSLPCAVRKALRTARRPAPCTASR